jgi:hypothetical protein
MGYQKNPSYHTDSKNVHMTFVKSAPKKSFAQKTDYFSVADPDPGSGAFLTPGSGIRNRFFPEPGSQTHIFESILKIFWVKTSTIL